MVMTLLYSVLEFLDSSGKHEMIDKQKSKIPYI